mgnify:FL=1|jgi:hypothetical protein
MSVTQIRAALRNAFGPRNYRIQADGNISVYGQMPNTNTKGWYLFGYVGDAQTELRITQL